MTGSAEIEGLEHALDALRRIPDPLRRLDALRLGRERLSGLESAAVREARHAGVTWKAIGALYGLSKQGAQQRFGGALPAEGR